MSSGSKKELYRSIAEQKLKSFSIGSMGKRGISRKEQEDLKKKQDEEEVGKVYEEFVSTFEDAPSAKVNKTWIKAGTFNAGNRKEDFSDKGKLYKPQSKIDLNALKKNDTSSSGSPALSGSKKPEKPGKKKEKEKKKSNLEIFKEELKAMQEEREERHRIKDKLRGSGGFGGSANLPSSSMSSSGGSGGANSTNSSKDNSYLGDIGEKLGSHDVGDPNTTNLYLGNLSPRLTEQQLLELFGKYGPLASIKIMWPRTEDEKARGRNCGFVAYMSRKDGERALSHLLGKDIDSFEMKMGWGKPVPIPLQPIYIPPALLRLTQPPIATGMPFNCQPINENQDMYEVESMNDYEFEKLVYKSKVKVVIPTDRTQLCLINRIVEFVIREGPMFEAMIMNREMNNRNFQFLFENKSPEHLYYRWRLYSMLQGDSKDDWNSEEFRMFKGGSIWVPPRKNFYTAGMPDDIFEDSLLGRIGNSESSTKRTVPTSDSSAGSQKRDSKSSKKEDQPKPKKNNGLSNSQRDRFEDMLRNLLPDRNPIAETMVWCIEHAEAGGEIVECIAESLSILQTPLTKKVARLYLISDILHNCSVKGVPNVSFFRKGFQEKLPEIFTDLNQSYSNIESRIRAEAFKLRVMTCFRAWEDWALYPQDFLIKLQNIFLGFVFTSNKDAIDDTISKEATNSNTVDAKDNTEEDEDDDDDVDGLPLDGAAMLKLAQKNSGSSPGSASSRKRLQDHHQKDYQDSGDDSDVDGVPLQFDEKNSATPGPTQQQQQQPAPNGSGSRSQKKPLPSGFVPSKWETVDPEEVQAQAVTSKWDIFDQDDPSNQKNDMDEEDIDGIPMHLEPYDEMKSLDEMTRQRLREIEVKVMCYQDDLESGKIQVNPGWTLSEQVSHFRKKMGKRARQAAAAAASAAIDTTPTGSGSYGTPPGGATRGSYNSDQDTSSSAHRSSRSKKKKSRRKSSSSSRSRSRSRSRSPGSHRDRKSRSSHRHKNKSGGGSSSDESSRRSKRRSRSPSSSSKKSKKRRY